MTHRDVPTAPVREHGKVTRRTPGPVNMRNRILIPTTGPDDWRCLLPDRVRHWKEGHSAHSLATTWERADGFPTRVLSVLETSDVDSLHGLSVPVAIPEYKTSLPGGAASSQTD